MSAFGWFKREKKRTTQQAMTDSTASQIHAKQPPTPMAAKVSGRTEAAAVGKPEVAKGASNGWVVRYRDGTGYVYLTFEQAAKGQVCALVQDPNRADAGPEMFQKLLVFFLKMDRDMLDRPSGASGRDEINDFFRKLSEGRQTELIVEMGMDLQRLLAQSFRKSGIATDSQLCTSEAVSLAQALSDYYAAQAE